MRGEYLSVFRTQRALCYGVKTSEIGSVCEDFHTLGEFSVEYLLSSLHVSNPSKVF